MFVDRSNSVHITAPPAMNVVMSMINITAIYFFISLLYSLTGNIAKNAAGSAVESSIAYLIIRVLFIDTAPLSAFAKDIW